MPGRIRGRGFTLLEALLVLGLVGLLTGWAMPALQGWLQQSRVTSISNRFLGVLQASRHQALALQAPVTVCTSPDGLRCSRDGGRHLLMFADGDGDGVLADDETAFLREELFPQDDLWLVWRDFRQTNYLRWVDGRTDSLNGTYTLCNSQRRDRWLRQIVLNRVGRARLVYPEREGGTVLQTARRRCGW